MTDVSAVIVNWNTRDILRSCLASVYGQTAAVDVEVVVVDNGSTDGSAAMVRQEFPQAVLVQNAENRGFAAGCNQGLALARGRYVLLLNSDTVVPPGTLERVVAVADRNPQAGVLGCQLRYPDGRVQPSCFLFPSVLDFALGISGLGQVFPRSRLLARPYMTWWDHNDEREVEVVTGCFMLVRREAFEQVGGLDESFFFYAEEADWCRRFRQAGWKVLFSPQAHIVHIDSLSADRVGWRRKALLWRNLIRLVRKHDGHWRVAAGLLWAHAVTRLVAWRLVAAASAHYGSAARERSQDFREILRHWSVSEERLRW